ncbi:hypothetical protein F4802DRAFT_292698 [Xylaria palmicola]|nr:hypothetical protein F4802DRAFT_292698 [Xylaria palmicola]
MVSIEVQPPTEIQPGAEFYPPMVIRCPRGHYSFFQVVLVSASAVDTVASTLLQGTLVQSPRAPETSSRENREDFAVFPDLRIELPGTYMIQVKAYQMDYEFGQPGAIHVAEVSTRAIQVHHSAATGQL